MTSSSRGKFAKSKVLFTEEFENLDHILIKISEDKLRLALNDYEKSVQNQHSWLTPLGVFFTLITAIITTDFKDALTLKKDTWEALYYFAAATSLIYSTIYFIKSRYGLIKINDLVEIIKNRKP